MTLDEIRSAIKMRFRDTTSDLNSILDSFINQAYRKYARKFRFPQLLVENYQITSVAGTEQYALPTDFWQMAENGVRYDVTSTQTGTRLAKLSQADLETWKLVNQIGMPAVWAIVPATSGSGRRIEFAPSFTETSKVIELDYYKVPAELAEDTDEPLISEIEDLIIYESLFQLAMYHSKPDDAQMFKMEVREQLNLASQSFTLA